jgi:plasmid stabilization system protein ParE
MEVRWSLPAANDLERICERIEQDNPEAARRVAKTVYDGCARLKDHPHLGRVCLRLPGRRELLFPPLPYMAVYQVTERAIEISRIFQSSRTDQSSSAERTNCITPSNRAVGREIFRALSGRRLGRITADGAILNPRPTLCGLGTYPHDHDPFWMRSHRDLGATETALKEKAVDSG